MKVSGREADQTPRWKSGEDRLDDISRHVREPEITACMAKSEALVVQSYEVQDGCMEVMHVADVIHGVKAKLVCRAMDHTASDAATCEEHAEALGMMVSPVGAGSVRGAAEFAGPEDESAFEQAALFEVADERGHSAVCLARVFFVPGFESPMLIPGAVGKAVGAVDLNETHSALDEAPRAEALSGVEARIKVGGVESVKVTDGFGLAGFIEDVWDKRLHTSREFVIAHGALDDVVAAKAGCEFAVLGPQEIELCALKRGSACRDDVFNGCAVRTDDRGFVARRQEAAAHGLHAADRHVTKTQHGVAWQVLIFAPEAVAHPGTEARSAREIVAGVKKNDSARVQGQVRFH